MSDLRNDLAKARDEYLASDAGKKACDPSTIGASRQSSHYLQNRIEAAFIAGWNRRAAPAIPDRKVVSQCPSSQYAQGWNDAVAAMKGGE